MPKTGIQRLRIMDFIYSRVTIRTQPETLPTRTCCCERVRSSSSAIMQSYWVDSPVNAVMVVDVRRTADKPAQPGMTLYQWRSLERSRSRKYDALIEELDFQLTARESVKSLIACVLILFGVLLASLPPRREPAPPGGIHKSAHRRKVPLSPAARAQSGGLVSMGPGGVREGASGEQADLSLGRLFDLSLVPRDGTRVVRERRSRRC